MSTFKKLRELVDLMRIADGLKDKGRKSPSALSAIIAFLVLCQIVLVLWIGFGFALNAIYQRSIPDWVMDMDGATLDLTTGNTMIYDDATTDDTVTLHGCTLVVPIPSMHDLRIDNPGTLLILGDTLD